MKWVSVMAAIATLCACAPDRKGAELVRDCGGGDTIVYHDGRDWYRSGDGWVVDEPIKGGVNLDSICPAPRRR